jgi:hypothetical protein
MPTLNGAAAADALRLLSPGSRIVAFSAALEEKPVWADAYLNKGHILEMKSLIERLASQSV